jgi:hypothetical protein
MDIRTYPGKVFTVETDKCVIRDENFNALKYQAGDDIPPGKQVGDLKMIPQGTEINVTEVKASDRKNIFVFARPAGDGGASFGWTKLNNLAGGMLGEVTGFSPASFEREPEGNNKTCFDPNAVIRGGPPTFAPSGGKIPQGSFVMVTERSADGKNVKVSKLEIVDGEMVVGDEIGWTRLANLADGCSSTSFSTPEWFNQKGPNGCWEHGSFLFPKVLVNIIGNEIEMEQITFETLAPYLKMAQAAKDEANLMILINSAFRTFQRQADLFEQSHHGGNKAAPAGASNHQHGQAFDLNTLHNKTDGSDPIYEWLKRNAPRHGFVRAVSNESWHWEYRPAIAAKLPPGEFMMPGIKDD